jgi:2-hydroxychromene-2-carboxylate isomerase
VKAILYFDFVSPWAYLMDVALRRDPLPVALERRPVLFAGILNAFGHKGPAEIERKRLFTYEHCTWTAQENQIPFQMPAVHPFNPLRYLRLVLGTDLGPEFVSQVFDALFTQGGDPESAEVWESACKNLGGRAASGAIDSPEVKARLKANTDSAIAAGIFGVPTITVDDRLFWGFESLPMLRAYLNGDPRLGTPAMKAAKTVRFGARRQVR